MGSLLLALAITSACGTDARDLGEVPNQTLQSAPADAAAPQPVAHPAPAPKAMEGEVLLTAQAEVTRTRYVVVHGTTNLPDGTKLLVTLWGASGPGAQDEPVVSRGLFRTATFTNRGAALDAGSYTASIVSANAQPAAVRAVIGERGEHLTGDLVEEAQRGRFARTETAFTIGRAEEGSSLQEHRRTMMGRLVSEYADLIQRGERMDNLRRQGNEAACGREMRANQNRARGLAAAVDSLALQQRLPFGLIIGNIASCVSCLPQAGSYCEIAAEGLAEARDAIR